MHCQMSVLDHLIYVNNGPSLVVCSPSKMCVCLAQSTEGQPRIKEAGGGLPGRGFGGCLGGDVSRVLWEELQNSQGAAWEHFAPREEGETNGRGR